MEGEIYISLERAIEHSRKFNVSIANEVCRLIIHGCLHLAGFDDREETSRKKMKSLEDRLTDEADRSFLKNVTVKLTEG